MLVMDDGDVDGDGDSKVDDDSRYHSSGDDDDEEDGDDDGGGSNIGVSLL